MKRCSSLCNNYCTYCCKSKKSTYLQVDNESFKKSPYNQIKLIEYTEISDIYLSEKNNKPVIIKNIDKTKRIYNKNIIKEQIQNEYSILSTTNHINIIKMIDYVELPTCTEFILEYCKYGDLFTFVNSIDNNFEESKIIKIMKQIINGLHYLHHHNISHRDLSLENILIYSLEPLHLKICDFGRSTTDHSHHLSLDSGKTQYLSPEFFLKNQYKSMDIWSLGIILYLLIYKEYFYDGSDYEIKYQIKNKKIIKFDDNNYSTELNDILKKLLDFDPETRITSEKLFNHTLFQ